MNEKTNERKPMETQLAPGTATGELSLYDANFLSELATIQSRELRQELARNYRKPAHPDTSSDLTDEEQK